jgi:predicted RNase H-like HicB family nuclease
METVTYTPRQVLITPGEDGWFVAEVPSLPGCLSQGRTVSEAIVNIREAIELYIADLEASGEPIPADGLHIQMVVV